MTMHESTQAEQSQVVGQGFQRKRIGRHEITGQIGRGAMGEVFRAHDPILNRDVAIKTMSLAIGNDEELRKRFQNEAQAAAGLNHPNIITVYDFGEEQGKTHIAMELLEGTDLKSLIGRHIPMTLEQKLELMEQTCDGVAFAHAKAVVHRDLKPANLHVQPNGQVKIMDFGLARLTSSNMTRAGMIMGTPNYMSPEQVRGEKADSRSDVFSLGAVFYELLADRKPFDADSLHGVLFQVMQSEPEALQQLVPDLPPPLAEVIEKALAKDATLRFRDAGEMREALRLVRAKLTVAPAEPHKELEALLDEEMSRHASDETHAANGRDSPPEWMAPGDTVCIDRPAADEASALRRPTETPLTPPANDNGPAVSAESPLQRAERVPTDGMGGRRWRSMITVTALLMLAPAVAAVMATSHLLKRLGRDSTAQLQQLPRSSEAASPRHVPLRWEPPQVNSSPMPTPPVAPLPLRAVRRRRQPPAPVADAVAPTLLPRPNFDIVTPAAMAAAEGPPSTPGQERPIRVMEVPAVVEPDSIVISAPPRAIPGMSADEVRDALGAPNSSSNDGKRWVYDGGKYLVEFDRHGQVKRVKEKKK